MSDPESFSPIAEASPKPYLVRLGLCFAFLYLLLYGLPFPLGQVPAQDDGWPVATAAQATVEWWTDEELTEPPKWSTYPAKWKREVDEEVVDYTTWFGKTFFDAGDDVKPVSSGSGDTLFDWMRAALMLAIALLAAPLLAIVLGNRSLRWFHAGTRVWVRYGLASTMCVYGFAKLYPLQFGTLEGPRLHGTFGDASPMNMLWTFMGSSAAYTMFSGAAEVLGGLLLFWRRTSLLGALVALGVMINVAALNLCYDVPVKLFSLHMVLFASFLITADLPRLWALFISRSAMPAPTTAATQPYWLLIPRLVLKLTVVTIIAGVPWHACHSRWCELQDRPPRALQGIWETSEFESELSAEQHWVHLTVSYWNRGGKPTPFARVQPYRGRPITRLAEIDSEAGTMLIHRYQKTPIELQFEQRSRPGATATDDPTPQLIVTGSVDGKALRGVLDYRDPATFRINRSSFRWVQQRPQNANRR